MSNLFAKTFEIILSFFIDAIYNDVNLKQKIQYFDESI